MIETLADICRETCCSTKYYLFLRTRQGVISLVALVGRTSVLNLRIETIQSIAYEARYAAGGAGIAKPLCQ